MQLQVPSAAKEFELHPAAASGVVLGIEAGAVPLIHILLAACLVCICKSSEEALEPMPNSISGYKPNHSTNPANPPFSP